MPELEPITREEKLLDGQDLEPITRREMFIKRIYDKTQAIPEPITREEHFLKKAGEGSGGDITVVSLSVIENGTYSEKGKAYSPVNVNVPLPENAYLLKSVNTPTPIASFNDGQEMVMPSLKVAIEPVQDLHGYDSPWVGGAGNNKLPSISQTQTINSVTWTLQSDGSIKLSGTATSNSVYDFGRAENLTLKSGSYFANENGTNYTVTIFRVVGGSASAYKSGGGAFSVSEDTEIFMRVTVPSGASVNETLYPMIESGSARTDYEPYSNICPIIGWDEVDVTVADDVENPTVSNVYTIDLDGTRYGGEVDVVNGIVTPAPYYASYNGETLTGEWISDRDKYEVGATPTIGAQVVNIGASGTPVSILPTAVKSLRGVNNVWADTGDITDAEYFSKEV